MKEFLLLQHHKERWNVEKLDAETEKILKSSPDFCELDDVLK